MTAFEIAIFAIRRTELQSRPDMKQCFTQDRNRQRAAGRQLSVNYALQHGGLTPNRSPLPWLLEVKCLVGTPIPSYRTSHRQP